MCKVVSEFSVAGKYKVLAVDEAPPLTPYRNYNIGGKMYTPVTVYDMPNGIAIDDVKESLIGLEVAFV